MDPDIAAMVRAVGEARTQLRDDALPRARTRRADVGPEDQAALLGALADLLDTARELAATIGPRMTTPDARASYGWAEKRLREQAENLRADERKLAPPTPPGEPAP
ncbi:hypothetical protein PUR71_23180 [Streptomyces sp. SP17BM10]|uniref:hypothetical protein n=1 Tax=Streptomyces sp. SP17BM10 TaxID=3002530 RepID=UPI002E76ECB7|nr:hypothetical protein [Streptomyces sp. SP17BM10]MEE1785785.1 hypothetical protein [Streptomyces sp. SP17BM10]